MARMSGCRILKMITLLILPCNYHVTWLIFLKEISQVRSSIEKLT